MKYKNRIFLPLMLMIITGCMATRFSDVWLDQSYKKGPVKNILVIAILPSPEKSKTIEDEMARQLKERGVSTVLGYVEFSGKPPSRDDVMLRIDKLGVDSVLLTKLSGRVSKNYQDYPGEHKAILRQWEESDRSPQPPLVGSEPQNYALVDTSLYYAETKKIIWSALTETWLVGMDSRLASSFVSTVLNKLADDKMIR